MKMKKWYASRTLWANAIATAALAVQSYTGYVIDLEAQAVGLAFVNVLLRVITSQGLEG